MTLADWSPSVDIAENDKEFLVKAELPDVKKDYGQVVTYGTVYSLLLLLIANLNAWIILIGLVTIAIRFMQALITIRSLKCPALHWWLWALPLRDLMSLIVWIGGAFGCRVHWRGRYLKIGTEGALTEVEQP